MSLSKRIKKRIAENDGGSGGVRKVEPRAVTPLTITIRVGVPTADLEVIALTGLDSSYTKRLCRRLEQYVAGGLEGRLRGIIEEKVFGAAEAVRFGLQASQVAPGDVPAAEPTSFDPGPPQRTPGGHDIGNP